ncbi:MAG TPA: PHB depolymerase family esterase [bacterium]|nr:PHB depolymerase family esterase [bacterium]
MKKLGMLALFMCVFALSCDDNKKTTADNDLVTDDTQTESDVMGDADQPLIDADQSGADEDELLVEGDAATDTDTVVPGCAGLKEGENTLIVNGDESKDLTRTFLLNLPTTVDSKKGWPVIFNFHGYGDTAANFEGLLSGFVDNAEMPFILVTPEDTDIALPSGVDWDILNLGNGSIEVELFDAILACIEEKWGVDEEHIHLAGFSAGSITADSIGVMRGDQIASIFTYSGAYFSDAKAKADLGAMASGFITWPEMTVTNKYVQAMMHGAEGDTACTGPTDCDKWGGSGFYINFNHMARFDANYLTEMGHTVIICEHALGHTNAGLNSQQMLQFFRDHPRGTTVSPYATNWPADYPAYCTLMTEPDPTIEPGYEAPDEDVLLTD